MVGLLGFVLAEGRVDVPEELTLATERSLQAGRHILRIDFLFEDAGPAFDRTAADGADVAVGTAANQIEAEWIEGMVGRNDEVCGVAGARARPEVDRLGGRLIGGFAPVVKCLGVEVQLLGDRETVLRKRAHALGRRHQQVVGRVVECISPEVEALETIGARDARIAVRQVRRVDRIGLPGLHRQVVLIAIGIGERIASPQDARAAALDRNGRDRAIGRADFLLLGVAQAEEQVAALVVEAPRDIGTGYFAIALVELAVVQRDLSALEVAAGDDVDHASDRVGTVERGCAVFQHLDAIDQCQRDRVEIDRRADAGRGRFVDPSHAIDQHQHALRSEIAQIDLCRTCAHTVAIRREAEVARRVELRVERRP